jgi:phosphomannomutase / phosphoglucomutase
MFPVPVAKLVPNTADYESLPMVKPTGFREYDARWLFEKEINLMGIQALGLGIGTLVHQMGVRPDIVVGHDFRGYSASIKYALISGLMASGMRVKDIGLACRRWPISASSRWIAPVWPWSPPRTTTMAGPA